MLKPIPQCPSFSNPYPPYYGARCTLELNHTGECDYGDPEEARKRYFNQSGDPDDQAIVKAALQSLLTLRLKYVREELATVQNGSLPPNTTERDQHLSQAIQHVGYLLLGVTG